MNWNRIAEDAILEALKRGDFEELPGMGKPLDLQSYFSAPEDVRAGWSVLKNANILPEVLEFRCEINRLQVLLCQEEDRKEKSRLRALIAEQETKLNLMNERSRKLR